jgi:hypothetical protein
MYANTASSRPGHAHNLIVALAVVCYMLAAAAQHIATRCMWCTHKGAHFSLSLSLSRTSKLPQPTVSFSSLATPTRQQQLLALCLSCVYAAVFCVLQAWATGQLWLSTWAQSQRRPVQHTTSRYTSSRHHARCRHRHQKWQG